MTKIDLLGIYETAINRIQLAYATLVIWAYPDTPDYYDQILSHMPAELQLYPKASALVRNETVMRVALDDLYNVVYRAALNDLFEFTKSYCSTTGQLAQLKAQPWFNFWRILRNYFSHQMRFNFNPAERALLPVSWSGVTIDATMNGSQLTHGQCSRQKLLELLESARSFVRSNVE